jgi:polysaccharide biosynthesis protein PelD
MPMQPSSGNGAHETGSDRRPPPRWQAWLETGALIAALIAVGALVDRRDPFLLQRGFSWFTLAPLLAGLQYGSTHGLACAAMQAVALAVAWRCGIISPPDSVVETVLGWLVAGLLAGEFRDGWLRRCGRLEALRGHLWGRLESLGRAYLALKISHDRLHRSAPGNPSTLRDALASFRRDVAAQKGPSLESLGDRILTVFSEQAYVRSATLHPVDRAGRAGPVVASLGGAAGGEDDALVRKAARYGLTTSVKECRDAGAVLAAVPLVDVTGRACAVVAIRDLPFLELHADTLELLAVLGGRLGDCVARAVALAPEGDGGVDPRQRLGAEPSPAAAVPAASPAPVPARVEEAA